jgi:hypothetical protein
VPRISFSLSSSPSDPSVYRLADEDMVFEVNRDASEWLFHDFDRLFEMVVEDICPPAE